MKSFPSRALLFLPAAVLLLAAGPPPTPGIERALAAVSPERIRARLKFLSDDLFEGRGTGARGSELAARYIASEFAVNGLKPAGDAGTYLQNFELVGVKAEPSSALVLRTPKGEIALKNGDNAIFSSRSQKAKVSLDAPLVFVGYGITAPEMNWDDYRGVDAHGKVLLCLLNGPPSDDPKFFGGKALTYYGRWTYKYEEAARRKAAGMIIIHTDKLAPYGWRVVRNSWSGEQAELPLEPGVEGLPFNGYITEAAAQKLFADIGFDLNSAVEEAGKRGFRAIPFEGSRAVGDLNYSLRRYRTENVAGLLEGSDPQVNDTAVVLTAHFDHLGIGAPDERGDVIYNGAVDNASGTAALLEIARSAADGQWRPRRSVLFLAVTAEEQGLLGSEFAARHPPIPLSKVAANFNMDVTSVEGELEDYCPLGVERTTLQPLFAAVASDMKIRLSPESHPERGSYFRSDHFSFGRAGVPAVSIERGWLLPGHDAAYGERLREDYSKHRYHQPSDEYDPAWDLSGAAQECRFVMRLVEAVSNLPELPRMKPGESAFGAAVSKK
jgi:Zn-dependent M28 family amino/carboxypeptidase